MIGTILRRRCSQTSLAIMIVLAGLLLCCGGTSQAWAQTGSFTSAADRVKTAVVNESIGTGYTASAVNRLSLQRTYGVGTVPNTATSGSISPARSAPSFGIGSSPRAGKPFDRVSSSPTLSPYLGLFNDSLSDSVLPNYDMFVRPQLQQQRFNAQVQRQASLINQRFQELTAQPAYQPRGSETQAPTGHPTTFGYHSHFYPGNNRRRR